MKAKTDKFIPNIKIGTKTLNEEEINICLNLCNRENIPATRANIVEVYKKYFY